MDLEMLDKYLAFLNEKKVAAKTPSEVYAANNATARTRSFRDYMIGFMESPMWQEFEKSLKPKPKKKSGKGK